MFTARSANGGAADSAAPHSLLPFRILHPKAEQQQHDCKHYLEEAEPLLRLEELSPSNPSVMRVSIWNKTSQQAAMPRTSSPPRYSKIALHRLRLPSSPSRWTLRCDQSTKQAAELARSDRSLHGAVSILFTTPALPRISGIRSVGVK